MEGSPLLLHHSFLPQTYLLWCKFLGDWALWAPSCSYQNPHTPSSIDLSEQMEDLLSRWKENQIRSHLYFSRDIPRQLLLKWRGCSPGIYTLRRKRNGTSLSLSFPEDQDNPVKVLALQQDSSIFFCCGYHQSHETSNYNTLLQCTHQMCWMEWREDLLIQSWILAVNSSLWEHPTQRDQTCIHRILEVRFL